MKAHGSIISMEVSDDRIRVDDTITISAEIENIGDHGRIHITQFLGWEDSKGIHYFINEIERTSFFARKGTRYSFENSFIIHEFLLRYQRIRRRIHAYTITSAHRISPLTYPCVDPGRPIILPEEIEEIEMHDIKSIALLIGGRPIEEPEPRINTWVIIVLIAIVLIILLWKG